MKKIFVFFCLVSLSFSLSLFAQTTTDNTASQLDAARSRALAEEQKLAEKEAKQKAAEEEKARKAEEKAQKAAQKAEAKNNASATQTATSSNDKGYSFWGRNAIGFNFAPTSQITAARYSLKSFKLMDGVKIDEKKGGFGMGFSYEHKLAKWVTLSGDFNFGSFGFTGSYDNINDLIDTSLIGQNDKIAELEKKLVAGLDFKTQAWSVGFRLYPKGKAPFGFFFYPRVGGTILNFSGYYPEYKGNSSLEAINDPDLVTRKTFGSKTHGIYAAVELGWRIQLFPKLMANSPVQIGIDISLIDLGYYFKPWTSGLLADINPIAGDSIKQYEKYMNIRVVPIPRLGITIKF